MPDPEQLDTYGAARPRSRIYFTQTFEERRSVWMERLKPLLHKLTTIQLKSPMSTTSCAPSSTPRWTSSSTSSSTRTCEKRRLIIARPGESLARVRRTPRDALRSRGPRQGRPRPDRGPGGVSVANRDASHVCGIGSRGPFRRSSWRKIWRQVGVRKVWLIPGTCVGSVSMNPPPFRSRGTAPVILRRTAVFRCSPPPPGTLRVPRP